MSEATRPRSRAGKMMSSATGIYYLCAIMLFNGVTVQTEDSSLFVLCRCPKGYYESSRFPALLTVSPNNCPGADEVFRAGRQTRWRAPVLDCKLCHEACVICNGPRDSHCGICAPGFLNASYPRSRPRWTQGLDDDSGNIGSSKSPVKREISLNKNLDNEQDDETGVYSPITELMTNEELLPLFMSTSQNTETFEARNEGVFGPESEDWDSSSGYPPEESLSVKQKSISYSASPALEHFQPSTSNAKHFSTSPEKRWANPDKLDSSSSESNLDRRTDSNDEGDYDALSTPVKRTGTRSSDDEIWKILIQRTSEPTAYPITVTEVEHKSNDPLRRTSERTYPSTIPDNIENSPENLVDGQSTTVVPNATNKTPATEIRSEESAPSETSTPRTTWSRPTRRTAEPPYTRTTEPSPLSRVKDLTTGSGIVPSGNSEIQTKASGSDQSATTAFKLVDSTERTGRFSGPSSTGNKPHPDSTTTAQREQSRYTHSTSGKHSEIIGHYTELTSETGENLLTETRPESIETSARTTNVTGKTAPNSSTKSTVNIVSSTVSTETTAAKLTSDPTRPTSSVETKSSADYEDGDSLDYRCVVGCPDGSYPLYSDQREGSCQPCDTKCKTCVGPSFMNCTACSGTAVRAFDHGGKKGNGTMTCLTGCPSNQHNEVGVCVFCHDWCEGCTGAGNTNCIRCRYYHHGNNQITDNGEGQKGTACPGPSYLYAEAPPSVLEVALPIGFILLLVVCGALCYLWWGGDLAVLCRNSMQACKRYKRQTSEDGTTPTDTLPTPKNSDLRGPTKNVYTPGPPLNQMGGVWEMQPAEAEDDGYELPVQPQPGSSNVSTDTAVDRNNYTGNSCRTPSPGGVSNTRTIRPRRNDPLPMIPVQLDVSALPSNRNNDTPHSIERVNDGRRYTDPAAASTSRAPASHSGANVGRPTTGMDAQPPNLGMTANSSFLFGSSSKHGNNNLNNCSDASQSKEISRQTVYETPPNEYSPYSNSEGLYVNC